MKKKITKQIEDEDFFFLTFVGEYVEVTTNLVGTDSETKLTIPISFRGFLLEHDEKFYYIGNGPGSIQHAIKKDIVAMFSIITPTNELDNILNDFKPEREEDIN